LIEQVSPIYFIFDYHIPFSSVLSTLAFVLFVEKMATPPTKTPKRKGARRRRVPNEIIDLSGYGYVIL
jgi:hypothetical protein